MALRKMVSQSSMLVSQNAVRVRSVATMIDGVKLAQEIKDEVKDEISKMSNANIRPPKLSVLLVGSDPASRTYVRNKVKACDYTGIVSESIKLPSTVTEKEVLDEITRLNHDDEVDAILVQLPVPPHISERSVCNAILPSKDVDGFHIANVGMLCTDIKCIIPATPAAVMEILRRYEIPTFAKHAVVCGRSKNVGMPISVLLHADGAGATGAGDSTTTICHRYTPPEQLAAILPQADIVVTATGIPGLIKGHMIKEGAAVVDVGITRVKNPDTGKVKLVGDCEFQSVKERAGFLTPVPGGVGPMTVAMLMSNTLTAAKRVIKYDDHFLTGW